MAHYTQEDYLAYRSSLDGHLNELRDEISETLQKYEKESRKFTRLASGWKYVVEWLRSPNRWPKVDTYETLHNETGRKVLYVNLDDFSRLSPTELSRYPFIKIVKGYPNAFLGSHLQALKDTFDSQPEGILNIQSYTYKDKSPVWSSTAAKVATDRLSEMIVRQDTQCVQPLIRDTGSKKAWDDRLPWNFLNLDGTTLDPVTSPASLHRSLRMLYTLCEEVKQRSSSKEFGKPYDLPESASFFADVQSCLRFLILGEKGTFSGNHLDILAGTWILGLSGLKLWWAFTGDFTEKNKEEFICEGASWNPDSMQLLPIEPGDYLMMMPGHLCAHAPFSMEDCLMTGGMFWNDNMLPQLLDNITWICEHNAVVSNEGVPRQLVTVLEVLSRRPDLSEDVREAMLRTEVRLRPLLSCSCKDSGGCKDECACASGGSTIDSTRDQAWWRSNGCTAWCECSCNMNGKNHGTFKGEKQQLRKRGRPPKTRDGNGIVQPPAKKSRPNKPKAKPTKIVTLKVSKLTALSQPSAAAVRQTAVNDDAQHSQDSSHAHTEDTYAAEDDIPTEEQTAEESINSELSQSQAPDLTEKPLIAQGELHHIKPVQEPQMGSVEYLRQLPAFPDISQQSSAVQPPMESFLTSWQLPQ